MGEIRGRCKKYLQIDEFRLGLTPLRTPDIAVDSRGFGREIDSLANPTNRHWSQWMKLSYGGPETISRSNNVTNGPIDTGPCGNRLGLRITIPQ